MQETARQMGFNFDGNHDPFTELTDFPRRQLTLLWEYPASGYANVMHGTSILGRTYLFDFWCEEGGDTDITHRQTVAAVHLSESELPMFSVRPRIIVQTLLTAQLTHKIGSALGHHDVDVSSHPDFHRRYLLRAPDENWARSLFLPELLRFWESLATNDRWAADGAGHWLIVFHLAREVPPSEWSEFLLQAETIAAAFRRAP